MSEPIGTEAPKFNWVRTGLRLAVIGVIAYGVHVLVGHVTAKTEEANSMPMMVGVLSFLLLCYTILMALPFAPGIEIGASLLILQGAKIAPYVYAATLSGLTLAFLAGRFLPYSWLHSICRDLRLRSVCRLLDQIEPLSRQERLDLLRDRLPKWAQPLAGGGKYLLLALLLNLPGNVLIGGGGGLALLAGITRLYSPGWTILTIALSVLPIPLGVWLYGSGFLEMG